MATDYSSLRSSRQATPRGTTPLFYVNPHVEFGELLARGATTEMCRRFSLEFTDAAGIVAWLDEDFIEEFAGPGMGDCRRWKLYLGRRLSLSQEDHDGSIFITDFMEEAVVYPPSPGEVDPPRKPPFETYFSEYEEVWVTQPRSLGFIRDSTTDDEPEQEANSEGSSPEDETSMAMYRNEYDEVDDEIERAEGEEIPPEDLDESPGSVIYGQNSDTSYEPDPAESSDESDSDDSNSDSFIDELEDSD